MTALAERTLSTPAGDLRALGPSAALRAGSGRGPLVVLLHGIAVTADMWRPILPALVDAGFSALALDLPGHGGSFRPARPMNITDLARVVDEALTALGAEDVRLVGNSLGGAVASEVALLRPDRVSRLVLADALGLDPHIPVFQRRYWTDLILPVLSTMIAGRRPWSHARVMRMVFHDPSRVPDDILVTAQGGDWVRNYWGRILVGWGVFRSFATPAQRRAFVQRRAELRCPTLIVWGENDHLLPVSHAHAGHALIPNSRLHIFPNCGHAPSMELPGEFSRAAIDFLRAASPDRE